MCVAWEWLRLCCLYPVPRRTSLMHSGRGARNAARFRDPRWVNIKVFNVQNVRSGASLTQPAILALLKYGSVSGRCELRAAQWPPRAARPWLYSKSALVVFRQS